MSQTTRTTDDTAPSLVAPGIPLRERLLALGGPTGSVTVALIAVLLIGYATAGDRFFTSNNLANLSGFVAIPIIVGICASFTLLSGVVDLSIGSMVGISAAVFAWLVFNEYSPWIAAALALAVCAFFGVVNAIAVVVFGADTLATTLGMLTLLAGLTRVVVGPVPSAAFIPALNSFTTMRVGPVNVLFLLAALLATFAAILVSRMRVGRHIRAAGGDEVGAKRAGIPVARIRFLAFVVSALGAGTAGILFIGQLGAPSRTLGTGLEFQVYAALLIGGYSILRGGVGSPIGGLFGILVVASITNIMTVQFIDLNFVNLTVGVLLIFAVFLDRLRGGDAFE